MSAFAKNEWRERLLGMFVFRGLLADVHERASASARPGDAGAASVNMRACRACRVVITVWRGQLLSGGEITVVVCWQSEPTTSAEHAAVRERDSCPAGR